MIKLAFVGREREIFRDCFNLLEENDLDNFVGNSKRIVDKYTELDDKMFCTEMLGVIGEHMQNIRMQNKR